MNMNHHFITAHQVGKIICHLLEFWIIIRIIELQYNMLFSGYFYITRAYQEGQFRGLRLIYSYNVLISSHQVSLQSHEGGKKLKKYQSLVSCQSVNKM
jgi:hypothetical protein